jgi:hypothetical protein
MTDTKPTHDQLVISNRDWVGPVLRLEPGAAHKFLSACDDSELAAIAELQAAGADKRTKLSTLKSVYSSVSERNMVRDPVAVAAQTPDADAPAAEPVVDEPKPTRRTKQAAAE